MALDYISSIHPMFLNIHSSIDVEQEDIDALNRLEEDEPSIDGEDEHEAGPAVIVTAFSDDEDSGDDPDNW